MANKKRQQVVRYSLLDFDSGCLIGEQKSLLIDLFTDLTEEIFCRLRDYLTYSEGMLFDDAVTYSPLDDDHFGPCYLTEGSWNSKKFGVLFV